MAEFKKDNVIVLPRPGKLTHVADVRKELAGIYRDARQGKLDATDLTRFAYALKILRDMIRDQKLDDLEQRIRDLEWKHATHN